jgi:hypothetical protein
MGKWLRRILRFGPTGRSRTLQRPLYVPKRQPTEVVRRVTNIPDDWDRRKNVSLIYLIRNSGYYESPEVLTAAAVEGELRRRPELLQSWFTYSDDQRSSPNWYVSGEEGGSYNVGFYSDGGHSGMVEFRDPYSAVAAFIVRQIPHMAGAHQTCQ